MDLNLVETSLLTVEEADQFNADHARVLATVGPRVPAETRARMAHACAAL
jgi:Xaa-Pro aminopeptidase